MRTTNLGDMAHNFMLQQRNTALKTDIGRLTEELATGQITDARQVLNGNYSYLTDIERSMDALKGYKVATTEATHLAAGMQAALERFGTMGRALSETLVFSTSLGAGVTETAGIAAEAGETLNAMIGVINTRTAGRTMFSGTATTTAPLASADDLIAGLRSAVAGSATPDDMIAAAKTWFDDPMGFSATMYRGSNQPLAPIALSDTDSVNLGIRSDDPALRETLRGVALAALATDPAIGFSPEQQAELLGKAGREMIATGDWVTNLQARVGFAESRIEEASSRNAVEKIGFEAARTALMAADPFETATQLESAQFQLQSLYAVTVRMSQLSLVNFL